MLGCSLKAKASFCTIHTQVKHHCIFMSQFYKFMTVLDSLRLCSTVDVPRSLAYTEKASNLQLCDDHTSCRYVTPALTLFIVAVFIDSLFLGDVCFSHRQLLLSPL